MPRDREAHLISISRVRSKNGTEASVLRFRGSVRDATETDFRSRLLEAGRRAPHLVVDLSELESLSAAGIGVLLDQARIQERRGGWLRLVAPSTAVATILTLSGADRTLPPWEDEDKAISDLPSRAA
jgi:anti-anti-sigma factor